MIKFKDYLKELLKPDVFITFFNYIIKIFLNPIIVVCVPLFLSETVQGYWYTFGSVAALTTFADLGFATIMTQFAAHEFTFLKFDETTGYLIGPQENIEKMSSLFQFVIQWITKMLTIAAILIFLVGVLVFSKQQVTICWMPQWCVYVVGTIINFGTQIELSFFEGCNQFAVTQKVRAIASTVHCISTIILLAAKTGLFALGIPLLIKAILVLLLLKRPFGIAVKQMLMTSPDRNKVRWEKEFLPLLGRYAISWICGYLAMQIYNPLAFAKYGSIWAGKVGYSLSIVTAIYSVANVWSMLAIPKYNMLVEKHYWNEMDRLLKKNITYASYTYILGVIMLFTFMRIPILQSLIGDRILSKESICMLCIIYFIQIMTYPLACYLRAHKAEPYLIVSALSGIISSILTVLCVSFLHIQYIFLGYLIAQIAMFPLAIFTWCKYRHLWHKLGGTK